MKSIPGWSPIAESLFSLPTWHEEILQHFTLPDQYEFTWICRKIYKKPLFFPSIGKSCRCSLWDPSSKPQSASWHLQPPKLTERRPLRTIRLASVEDHVMNVGCRVSIQDWGEHCHLSPWLIGYLDVVDGNAVGMKLTQTNQLFKEVGYVCWSYQRLNTCFTTGAVNRKQTHLLFLVKTWLIHHNQCCLYGIVQIYQSPLVLGTSFLSHTRRVRSKSQTWQGIIYSNHNKR